MIQIMDVKKSFGTEEVLHGITREFEPGKSTESLAITEAEKRY